MIDLETYLFDSLGFYHRKNAICPSSINTAVEKIEELEKTNDCLSLRNNIPHKIQGWESEKIFLDLILHDSVLNICKIVFGEDFRLDHAFIVHQSKTIGDLTRNSLHGETHGVYNSHFYHTLPQTHIKSPCKTNVGQLSVGIVLKPQNEKTGGVCYIPGSHKSSYILHGAEVTQAFLKNDKIFRETVRVPELNPGDVIAFPENLIHGTTTMLTDSKRQILYAMFFPISQIFDHNKNQINKLIQIADNKQKKYLLTFQDFNNTIHTFYIKKRQFIRDLKEWCE